MNKKITIELESYADNETIKSLFESITKDNFRTPIKINVEDLK